MGPDSIGSTIFSRAIISTAGFRRRRPLGKFLNFLLELFITQRPGLVGDFAYVSQRIL